MADYLIVIGKTSTGYSAHCPDVLGCASVGKTVEEVVANMKKALALHFEGMAEDGDPIPQPGGVKFVSQGNEGSGCGSLSPGPCADRHQPICGPSEPFLGAHSGTHCKPDSRHHSGEGNT
jgi:predicted RNase H-like HicB family nuclease